MTGDWRRLALAALAATAVAFACVTRVEAQAPAKTTAKKAPAKEADANLAVTAPTEDAAVEIAAANEALKAAHVKLIDASLFGAYGRLYLSGSEAQIDAAREAAVRSLANLRGRDATSGSGA